jgi:DNA-binding response OmpR family regulator/anti-sigma regulatory factor (Ser/Thr protein kinase)
MTDSALVLARILVVDDLPAAREVLAELLQPEGYVLQFAASGAEALRLALESPPDVILLDVMMPDMDGYEVCQRLRAAPQLAEVPILFLSALIDRESRLRGFAAGADDFLAKPFDRAELRVRLRNITRLNRYRQLLAQRAEFQWVVEQAASGVVLLNRDDTVRYANPRAVQLLDLPDTPAALVGRPFLEAARCRYRLVPEMFWQTWPALPAEWARPFLHLVRPETPTACALWLHVQVLDAVAGRRLVRLENRTETVQAQREAWTFQSQVSHKLRTPLSGLMGCLHLLQDELGTLPPPARAEMLAAAVASAQRLEAAVGAVLQSVDHAPAAKGPDFPLGALPELAQRLFAPQPREHLTISGLERLASASLTLNAAATETILGELLENAVKFHPARRPHVGIALELAPDGQLLLRVSDDGVSLTPEQRGLAFVPYYQGEKRPTGEVPGMGLGLPMVGALVLESGGRSRLLNREDGPGIVVELTLPLAPAQPN